MFANLTLSEAAQATAVQLSGISTATFEECNFRGSTPDFLSQPLLPSVIHLGDNGTALLLGTSFNDSGCQAGPSNGGMLLDGQSTNSTSTAPEIAPCIAGTGAASEAAADTPPVDTAAQPPGADAPSSISDDVVAEDPQDATAPAGAAPAAATPAAAISAAVATDTDGDDQGSDDQSGDDQSGNDQGGDANTGVFPGQFSRQ